MTHPNLTLRIAGATVDQVADVFHEHSRQMDFDQVDLAGESIDVDALDPERALVATIVGQGGDVSFQVRDCMAASMIVDDLVRHFEHYGHAVERLAAPVEGLAAPTHVYVEIEDDEDDW